MQFRKINNITGWIICAIATLVYTLTLELTASYWDAGEFIAVSYKLMVPHPPGAPFYLLIGRLFSFLALGEVERVAFWINMVSVLCSSGTILFMFWTITMLGRKILGVKIGEETSNHTLLLMGAGVVGAFAYTFSDSFWFSAVEAEVYAMSSFFTAIVVWTILKWELIEDSSKSNRWLLLMAYLIGLSIGVHLLNLVTFPALALVYYFKRKNHQTTLRGILITLTISTIVVLLINDFIIPGLPLVAGSFEIFFVNSIGMPFGTGVIVFVLLFLSALAYGIYWSQKNRKELANTALLSFAFILIGYSSYSLIVIRSSYDPPIDQNDPSDIMSVVSYLKREQYGSRPLLHGAYFTAKVVDYKVGARVWVKGEEKYEVARHKIEYVFDPEQTTIFPRAWSSTGDHPQRYREILGLMEGEVPTFTDNIVYFFKRQVGFMYLRYFMWNFAGRQSDIQDAAWLSPVLSQKDAPPSIKNNRARNNYFMIPLLLGLIGFFYTYRKNREVLGFIFMLFILLGVALVFYLNSPPVEPRERDYIYVGSYYAFAIWIGMSVLGMASLSKRVFRKNNISVGIAIGLGMIAPLIMALQNWDDHDRSDRYFSVDSAKNFLASCAPNAILFTGGDNDTFPLWYVQEVEGFRTDVRVVVLTYANTDWYIEQMTRKAYESDPFPFTLSANHYRQGGPNDALYLKQLIDQPINAKQFINLINENNPQLRRKSRFGDYNLVPSKDFYLDINLQDVIKRGIIPKSKMNLMVERMSWQLQGNVMEKKDLMILDLIVTNNWDRPIYFNNTSLQGINFNFEDYLIQEGQTFRLLPIKNDSDLDFVNTDIMYDNLMNKFHFRELDSPNVYYNERYRNFVLNQRSSFNTLAEALITENKKNKAIEVIHTSLERMPDIAVPYDYTATTTVELLFQLEEIDTAKEIASNLAVKADRELQYYIENHINVGIETQKDLFILRNLSFTMDAFGEDELALEYSTILRNHSDALQVTDWMADMEVQPGIATKKWTNR